MKRTEKFCLVDRSEKTFPSKFSDSEVNGFQYVLMDKKGKFVSIFSKDHALHELDEMDVINVADGFDVKKALEIELEAEFYGGTPKWRFGQVI